ncbi:MAG: TonB-dependent receptor [Rhodoferax sp.]|nr:TonB-dependent receptor [Rhodoferax sp.]
MKNFKTKRSLFALAPVAAGCAVLLVSTSSVYAQDANLGSVTVTGIRAAIESAIAVKKGSDNIVEAVSSEDLGKLPDNSIAESISRLPGVSAQRNRTTGKASDVSVRGMSPDFNGTLLNGREQATAGDARGASFDQFPSELLSSVLIYKTPDAALLGQGLASTIDMRTVRPLDYKTRVLSANYRKQRTGVSTDQDEGSGTRKSFSYVDQFMDRTIGVALGFTQMKEEGAASGNPNNWGGWSITRQFNGQDVKIPGGMGGDISQTDQERKGVMAVLQFKPSANFESTIDFFSSKGSTFQKATGIEANVGANCPGELSNFCYDAPSVITAATVVNGRAESGTINNWKGVVRNHTYGESDEFESYGWNNKFTLGNWKSTVDYGHSKSLRVGGRLETTAGLPGSGTGGNLSWTGYTSDGAFPKFTSSVNYADASVIKLTDVFGWSGNTDSNGNVILDAKTTPQAGYAAQPTVEDKLDTLRLSTKTAWTAGPVAAVEFGFNYSDRAKHAEANEGRLVIKGSTDPFAGATIPGGSVVTSTSGIPILSWNPAGSVGTIYDIAAKVDAPIWAKIWTVKEKVTTGFVKGDLDGDLFGLPYVGNVGMQWVNTDQSSEGFQQDKSKCSGNTATTCPASAVTAGSTYNDFLPSLNMSFNLGGDQVLRLGVARVMARANMSDMRPGFWFGVDNAGGSTPMLKGEGGNINLEPFRANSFDLSYEKYFGKKGYFSAAAFYKNLNSYIYKIGQTFDFSPYVTAATVLPASGSKVGLLTVPRNGEGGRISGYELALSVPFSMASDMLNGFGAQVNFSNTDSAISIPSASVTTVAGGGNLTSVEMPGLSRQVTNLKFYYESNGWQLAVSQRRRSDFLGSVIDVTNDQRAFTYIRGEAVTDLQAGYEFNSGYLKGLSLLLQANNVNNSKFEQYDPKTGETTQSTQYGKTYLMGLNYKF